MAFVLTQPAGAKSVDLISWREPVRVLDTTLYASSAAFPVGGIIDGVALVDGDRVLFSNVTISTEENVWIWNALATSWSEDINDETDGDTLSVQDGTHVNEQWLYNGTQWIFFSSITQSATITGSQVAAVLTTIDTLPLTQATQAKWMVQVRDTGIPANRSAREIHALSDGVTATFTTYASLNMGPIPGLAFNVTVSGSNLILTVNSTNGVDYVVKRIAHAAF